MNEYKEYAGKILNDLCESQRWLDRSFGICKKIGVKDEYTAEEFDAFENLCSRFARTSDLIIQKVFRCIDKIELEDGGSLIDVVNRAHKRGIVNSVDKIREIRELRNEIAHEYTDRNLKELFSRILQLSEDLFEIIENIKVYFKKMDEED